MIIRSLEVSGSFRYLWLKRVIGVDLSRHCARCLVGSYSKSVDRRTKSVEDLPLEDGVWYLCGVSEPYVWSNNFHLAFEADGDSSIEVSENGVSVSIEGARALPISEEFIDESDPRASVKSYRTCRNWQLANFLRLSGRA